MTDTIKTEKKVIITGIRHGHANQYLTGMFTIGMTKDEVYEKVKGPFGGTFTQFDPSRGAFAFTSYVD